MDSAELRPKWVDDLKAQIDHLYLSDVWPDPVAFKNRLAVVALDHAVAMQQCGRLPFIETKWMNVIHNELYADGMAHRESVRESVVSN